ncbi:MAG: hypothetical protein AAF268_04480 [Cyanobacteria bacterium P01_A01_bin.3]
MKTSEPSGLAIAVFGLSLLALLSPVLGNNEWVPVGVTSLLFGAVVLDRVAMQGRFTGLMGARWGWTDIRQERVLYHEAGHLLAACCLDIPVLDYALDPWQAFRKGYPGYGGIQLDDSVWQGWLDSGSMTRRDVERYSIMWMAGGVAERQRMGDTMGDRDDRLKLQQLVGTLRRSGQPLDSGYMQRWARLQARSLLEEQAQAYDVAVSCMRDGMEIEACLTSVKATLVQPQL